MTVPKWTKRDLIVMGKNGYKVVPCKDEEECLQVKEVLKANKRCAQVGHIFNREGTDIFFVVTKENLRRGFKKDDKGESNQT